MPNSIAGEVLQFDSLRDDSEELLIPRNQRKQSSTADDKLKFSIEDTELTRTISTAPPYRASFRLPVSGPCNVIHLRKYIVWSEAMQNAGEVAAAGMAGQPACSRPEDTTEKVLMAGLMNGDQSQTKRKRGAEDAELDGASLTDFMFEGGRKIILPSRFRHTVKEKHRNTIVPAPIGIEPITTTKVLATS